MKKAWLTAHGRKQIRAIVRHMPVAIAAVLALVLLAGCQHVDGVLLECERSPITGKVTCTGEIDSM